MNIIQTKIESVIIIEPTVSKDNRGYFMETYQKEKYADIGIRTDFVQDNLSFSTKGTLRGFHYQYPNEQAKLVQVMQGEVYDVAVDIRKGSPTFGKWVHAVLSGENKRQFFIPAGFAHGFCVTSETAIFTYKCSDFYAPESEGGILWSDPDLNIPWPVETPVLSEKDQAYKCLKDVPEDRLPIF